MHYIRNRSAHNCVHVKDHVRQFSNIGGNRVPHTQSNSDKFDVY